MIHRVKIRSIILSLIVLGLFASSAMAVAPTLDAGTGTVSPTSGIVGLTSFNFTATFTDTSNDSLTGRVNVTILGISQPMVETNPSDYNTADGKEFSYTAPTLINGTHKFNFSASDGLGWDILNAPGVITTVQVNNPELIFNPSGAQSIDALSPFNLQLSAEGGDNNYTYSYIAPANFSSFSMSSSGEIDFTPKIPEIGNPDVKITVTSSSGLQTNSKNISFTINAPGASGGNRIWTKDFSDPYEWNAQSFTGFYYNIDDDIKTEMIEIKGMKSSRTIDEGDITYTTNPQSVSFEFGSEWGKYDVVGFMAEKYFAGYNDDTERVITDDSPSLLNDNMLSKVLTDSDEKYTLNQGDSLDLQEGYAIKINQLDINGNQVMLEILKDGKSVDTGIVKPDSNPTYAYEKDVGAIDDLPIIVLHIDSVFQGTETSAVTINGLFQISDEYKSVEAGDKYGIMEVSSTSRDELKLENSKDVSLSKGNTIDLFGDVKIKVADNDNSDVRFELTIEPTDGKTREIRGTVSESDNLFIWDPYNFEGFYYNLDEDIKSETMIIDPSVRTIDTGDLTYVAQVQEVEFAYSSWDTFQVIGFMAEQYFAGYSGATHDDITDGDTFSFVKEEMLSKVLVDTDVKYMLNQGDTLKLEEGYELKINQLDINGNQVMLELLKDGKSIDTGVVRAPDTYRYTKDVGNLDDVPLVIASIQSVFAGTETSAVTVNGVFQISDNYKTVEIGTTYDEMEIQTITSSTITMENEDDISLSAGKTIKILGNISLKVADNSSTLRYYPFVEVAGSADEPPNSLAISVPDKLYTDEAFIIKVTSDGEGVKGVEVEFDGDVIGKTNSDGEVEHTATDGGNFDITATKSGFTEASKEVDVEKIPDNKKLQISISPDRIKENHAFTITVSSPDGVIEDANVDFDGKRIGKTDSDGKINYTQELEGTYTVLATKSSFLKASTDVTIVRPPVLFSYSNLTITPERVKPEKHVEITIDVENVGEIDGVKAVEFKVNGEVVDSRDVTLNMTESTNVNFSYIQSAEGIYSVEVGDQTGEFEVKATSILKIIVLAVMAVAVVGAGATVYLVKVVGMSVEEIIAKIQEMVESVR
ncbi:MAG: S-layer protein [Methanosarcinales archaeon]|nr:S-layer protein [Methanosarcinales archaeon]